MRHIHPALRPLGISGAPVSHQPTRPHQIQQDLGMMGKSYSQYSAEALVTAGLEELRGSAVMMVLGLVMSLLYLHLYNKHFKLL